MNVLLTITATIALSGQAVSSATPASAAQTKSVLSLDLTRCPEGPVLEFELVRKDRRRFGPPSPEVNRHFAGWRPGLSGWKGVTSNMKVAREHGVPVLVNSPGPKCGMPGRTLVGGDPTWRDYDIEASVRLVDQGIIPLRNAYGEHTTVPHVGVFGRSTDSIRFYMLALEPARVSLYLMRANEWAPLARRRMQVEPNVYYTLRLSVSGELLRGYVDGQLVAEARDATYPRGKAGVRFNAEARVNGVRVLMAPAQKAEADRAKAAYEAEVAAARAKYAKPVVLKTLKLPGPLMYPAHLRSADSLDFVVVGGKTWGIDLDGKILWEYPSRMDLVAPGRPGRDGVSRVVGLVSRKRYVMLDGRTGKVLRETKALPPPLNYGCWRLGNLTGTGEVNYVARSGDTSRTVTVYDEKLQVLFTGKVAIDIGHTHGVAFWDVDGDGVEELQAGGTCFRGDGSHLWDSRVTEQHLDQVALGPLGPHGEPTSVFIGVDDGVTFVDGMSGDVLSCVPSGHAQGVLVGNFRPEVPGLEVLTESRWASYGVTGLFTGRGRPLKQWMLAGEDYYQPHLPVTWGEDGSDLIMISRLFDPPTFYDGHGHQVFQLPEGKGYRSFMTLFPLDVTGDGRDEILSVNGATLTVYTQDRPLPAGAKTRPSTVKWMNMSLPAWTLERGENVMPNGGFEEVNGEGKPMRWTLHGAASVVSDPSKAFRGNRAVRVNFNNSAWCVFPVKPETAYTVTGMVRHEEPAAVDPGRLKILFKNEDGVVVHGVAARMFSLSANRYRGFQCAFETPAIPTTCHFGLCGRFTGSDYVLYDNVAVRGALAPRE